MDYPSRKATPLRCVTITVPLDETTAELAKVFYRLALTAEEWGEEEDVFCREKDLEEDERMQAQENAMVWWGKHVAWRKAGFELSAAAGIAKPDDSKLKT